MDFMSEFEEVFDNFFKGFPVMAFPLPNGTFLLSSTITKQVSKDILNDLYNDSLGESQRKGSEYCGRRGTIFPMDFMSEFEEVFDNFFKGFPVMAFPLPNEDEIPSLIKNEDVYNDSNSTLQERMLNDKTADKQNLRSTSQFPFSFDGSRRPFNRFNEHVTREDR
ncbi:Hypothetical predicted protein, partial [Paramuricea clavata]